MKMMMMMEEDDDDDDDDDDNNNINTHTHRDSYTHGQQGKSVSQLAWPG